MVIEYFENEEMDLFVLKNNSAAYRLSELLKEFNNSNGLANYIYFQDPNLNSKVRIYDLLEERYNITRIYMQRPATR